MLEQIKRLFKHSFIYALGNIAQSVIAFILIPIYTRYLIPSEYGKLEILNTILLALSTLLTFGFASAIIKTYERDADTEEKRREMIGTAFLFIIPISTVISLLVALLAPFLSDFFLGGPESTNLMYLVIATNLFVVFSFLSFAVLRAQEKSKKYITLSIIKFSLILVLNIIFVVVFKMGVQGILIGNLIAQVVLAIFFIPEVMRKMKFVLSKHYLRRLMAFGAAVVPAAIAMWVMDLADRYFLRYYEGLSAVGIYSLGYKIGLVTSILLVFPFQLAWPTVSFSVAKRDDAKKIYARVLTYFMAFGFLLVLTLSYFARFIIRIMSTPDYIAAYSIVPFVALSYLLLGIHYIIVVGLHLKEKYKYYPIIIIIPAIFNIAANIFLIPNLGMYGAALSTLLSFILLVILTYYTVRWYYKVEYEVLRIAKICGAALASFIFWLVLVIFQVVNDFWWGVFPIILYLFLLLLFRVLEKKEVEFVKGFIKKNRK